MPTVLPNDILMSIDPSIRPLIVDINKLSFVKQTTFSCSGNWEYKSVKEFIKHHETYNLEHPENLTDLSTVQGLPHVEIEYLTDKEHRSIVNKFHTDLAGNPNIVAEIRETVRTFLLFGSQLKRVTYRIT